MAEAESWQLPETTTARFLRVAVTYTYAPIGERGEGGGVFFTGTDAEASRDEGPAKGCNRRAPGGLHTPRTASSVQVCKSARIILPPSYVVEMSL